MHGATEQRYLERGISLLAPLAPLSFFGFWQSRQPTYPRVAQSLPKPAQTTLSSDIAAYLQQLRLQRTQPAVRCCHVSGGVGATPTFQSPQTSLPRWRGAFAAGDSRYATFPFWKPRFSFLPALPACRGACNGTERVFARRSAAMAKSGSSNRATCRKHTRLPQSPTPCLPVRRPPSDCAVVEARWLRAEW